MAAASVDSSLWWDSFSLLLTDLENAPACSDLPPSLVKRVKDNHAWCLDLVSGFKPPNQKSKEALNSEQVNVGSHRLTVIPQLKDAALQISSCLCLDEVQSYILVNRFSEQNDVEANFSAQEFLHVILLQYYIERQCLLKCTRQILGHALYDGVGSKEDSIKEEVLRLVADGMEGKLLSVLQNSFASSHPDQMGVDLFTLWAEEILIEDSLILDILFLAYYESFCTCNGEQWRKLCTLYKEIIFGSLDIGRLAVSTEAVQSCYHVKVQLLLILMETLDLDHLLKMVHDEMPLRPGSLVFSNSDILQMDAIISSFSVFEVKEAGPLILTWAVFLCLVSSLPKKQENNLLMEIDHVGYVRQAFEAASLNFFLEILQSNVLKDLDGPIADYQSVMRTLISAFVASYEISLEQEDTTLKLILDILCQIYRGEESLCIQFWDKGSFIDGPIRCLLRNIDAEFPLRIVELVRFLSALSEGPWPAECAYNYLEKSVEVSSLFKIGNDSLVDNPSQIVEADMPLRVPGVEGLIIPNKTRGHILKVTDGNVALVRWENAQSAVLVLLLRLARELYVQNSEEVFTTLDLFSRLVSFNLGICCHLLNLGNSVHDQTTNMDGQMSMIWVDPGDIICTLIRNVQHNSYGAVLMSMGITILAKMLMCSPSRIAAVALKLNIFEVSFGKNTCDVGISVSSSGSWLLSGRLARLLLIDCEQNDNWCPLTISVLEFTMRLLAADAENELVLPLLLFTLQYVLVNHEYWKYKAKHVKWNVTLKALEVMKKCITSIPHFQKQGATMRDIILSDSSIHNALFRIICTTSQTLEKLYVTRLYDLMEIEGLQLAICSALDIIFSMLSSPPVDSSSSLPAFHHAVLSSTTRPIPVFPAMISLMSYSQNPAIQVGAARVLSMFFVLSDYIQENMIGSFCFGWDDKQIRDLKHSFTKILCEHPQLNEDLFVAFVQLLISAAHYQPVFLLSIIAGEENGDVQLGVSSCLKPVAKEVSFGPPGSNQKGLLHAVQHHVELSNDLMKSNPRILLNILQFLKALWQGAAQYKDIVLFLRNSEKFWKQLISLIACKDVITIANLNEKETYNLAYRYQCQSVVLEIMMHEIFFMEQLQHPESPAKQTAVSSRKGTEIAASTGKLETSNLVDVKGILLSWYQGSVLDDVIKTFASCEYDNEVIFRAKVAASLFVVHVMGKLNTGDPGCLSVLLINKVHAVLKKLILLPSFSELIAQYSRHGYRGGAINALILSDLYYHLEGELEGRKIDAGPFKELSEFLLDSDIFRSYKKKHDGDIIALSKEIHLFELARLQADLGLDAWNHTEWKASRTVADTLLLHMQDANSMLMVSNSKLSALRALTNMLCVYNKEYSQKNVLFHEGISKKRIHSCTNNVCRCLHATVESLAPARDASEEILNILEAQAELLLHCVRFMCRSPDLPIYVVVLKTSSSALKVLSSLRPSISGVSVVIKLLLEVLLLSTKSYTLKSLNVGGLEEESVDIFVEVSNVSLGLLPILCKCIESAEHCALSLSSIDVILASLSSPRTWFPIMQKYLPLKHLVLKLQDRMSNASIPIILKFFLTLARVRDGAEMLLAAGFFQSLRILFAGLSDGRLLSANPENISSGTWNPIERPEHIWGFGLVVVTAIIQSLGDSSWAFIVDDVIPYFFAEKGYLISYYLTAPDFPSDNQDRKRARSQRTHTSLSLLRETEITLLLICAIARHQKAWVRTMKEKDSLLRESTIHLLAFISRGIQRHRESPVRMAPLLCPPVLKEEYNNCMKPSYFDCKSGWFALSPLGCSPKEGAAAAPTKAATLCWKDQVVENTSTGYQTNFSDSVAVQMYRISFLLLRFLCLQAEGAIKRAEDVGFVDVAHFPELPVPEILHGLQDQAVAIVTELCDKSKTVEPETQTLCFLLVQIMEMALYLELCVSQICGLRPVLSHVEDFTKEVKLVFKVAEAHGFLRAPMASLKQIISHLYPGLLENGGFFLDAS